MGLTRINGIAKRHLAFIDAYFECNLNGTEAYLKVYPDSSSDTARANASRLLASANIREEVNRRLTDKHMGADEVLARLAEQAQGVIGNYVDDNGKVDFKRLKEDNKAYLIQGVEPTKFSTKVQFPNSQTALLNIGKQHGLFSDRHIIETKVEKELDSILATLEEELSADDFQRILLRLTSGQAGGSEVAAEPTD